LPLPSLPLGIGEHAAPAASSYSASKRCYVAIMLVQALCDMLKVKEPGAAAEVLAAAAPPQKLLVMLHGAGRQLLEMLETGTHVWLPFICVCSVK
jgi:hypothetical protein